MILVGTQGEASHNQAWSETVITHIFNCKKHTLFLIVYSWLQAEVEVKENQLQKKDTQLWQQDMELRERATEIHRQQRDLQVLRVRNWTH